MTSYYYIIVQAVYCAVNILRVPTYLWNLLMFIDIINIYLKTTSYFHNIIIFNQL